QLLVARAPLRALSQSCGRYPSSPAQHGASQGRERVHHLCRKPVAYSLRGGRRDVSPDRVAFFALRGRPANLSISAKARLQKQSGLAPKAVMRRKKTRLKDKALLPGCWHRRCTRPLG